MSRQLTEIDLIEEMVDLGATDSSDIMACLCDGDLLGRIGLTDSAADTELVEDTYAMVKAAGADLDAHLAAGGTIGNYQW